LKTQIGAIPYGLAAAAPSLVNLSINWG